MCRCSDLVRVVQGQPVKLCAAKDQAVHIRVSRRQVVLLVRDEGWRRQLLLLGDEPAHGPELWRRQGVDGHRTGRLGDKSVSQLAVGVPLCWHLDVMWPTLIGLNFETCFAYWFRRADSQQQWWWNYRAVAKIDDGVVTTFSPWAGSKNENGPQRLIFKWPSWVCLFALYLLNGGKYHV